MCVCVPQVVRFSPRAESADVWVNRVLLAGSSRLGPCPQTTNRLGADMVNERFEVGSGKKRDGGCRVDIGRVLCRFAMNAMWDGSLWPSNSKSVVQNQAVQMIHHRPVIATLSRDDSISLA